MAHSKVQSRYNHIVEVYKKGGSDTHQEKIMTKLKILALITSLAIIIRMVIPLNDVFNAGFINFLGPDSYYHASVLKGILANFPTVPSMYIQDWVIVGIAWLVTFGEPSMRTVELIAIFTPPLMAGAVILLVYFISSRLFGRVPALIAASFAAFIPGEFLERTLLGNIDHHAAEVLVTTAIMAIVVYVITSKSKKLMALGIVCLPVAVLVYYYCWPGLGRLITSGFFSQSGLTLATTTEAVSITSLSPYQVISINSYQILHILLGITCLAALVKSGTGWQRFVIAAWLLFATGVTTYQLRFDYYLIVPLGIVAGYALHHAVSRFSVFNFINLFVAGLLLIHSSFIYGAILPGNHLTPSADWNWAAIWIKGNTSDNTTLLAWWDYGHFLRYRAEREPFVDPGQCSNKVPIAARVLLSNSDNINIPADYIIIDSKTAYKYNEAMCQWAGIDHKSLDSEKTLARRLYTGQEPKGFELVYDSTVKIWSTGNK